MSTQQVQATTAGRTVTGAIVDRHPTADFGVRPRDDLVLDVGDARYCVDEEILK